MSWASLVENQRLPTRLICEHIIENRSKAGRSIIPPISTAIPPRRRVASASVKDSAGAPGPTASMTMSAPSPLLCSRTYAERSPSPTACTSIRSGARAFTSCSRAALRPVPRMRLNRVRGRSGRRRCRAGAAGSIQQRGVHADDVAFDGLGGDRGVGGSSCSLAGHIPRPDGRRLTATFVSVRERCTTVACQRDASDHDRTPE